MTEERIRLLNQKNYNHNSKIYKDRQCRTTKFTDTYLKLHWLTGASILSISLDLTNFMKKGLTHDWCRQTG